MGEERNAYPQQTFDTVHGHIPIRDFKPAAFISDALGAEDLSRTRILMRDDLLQLVERLVLPFGSTGF
jgi:hypothetical protein